ncbi:methenyltetrahydrofolate synthase domain-containing protein isoform X3 [Sciurus carolinensis]|uniref:methenyltetrahydrofolate synthase domain-containing protein isoform X3 n=1 Tax=Sciurus carolinensis TaxID=30640 RepID=UPI001FB3330F|nr:methenyltetrahydrofolate synthase domain-containing protein isoform X3 [Sciurus carolinensis]
MRGPTWTGAGHRDHRGGAGTHLDRSGPRATGTTRGPTRTGISKQDIREQIWDYMESQNLADFPRPVHHRIPNFKGSARAAEHFPRLQGSHRACQNIRDLEVFARTQEVKVDPDKPLEGVRLLALQSKKTLLVPTPRLRTGLFNRITPPPGANKDMLRKCATSQGVRSFSVPVGLDASVLVDLVVVGSVAVSEKGWRIGKGEGYADLEYAMMVSMGAVHEGTPVVTIVHDCQVVDFPEALLGDHDLTVDYILTPTRLISTGCRRPKPAGITWSKISREMLEKIPVLRSLREREKRAGKDVSLQAEHKPLLGPASQRPAAPSTVRRPQDASRPGADSPEAACSPLGGEGVLATVCVGNLPRDARVSDLKRALRELGVAPLQLTWRGLRHRALLHYQDLAAAQRAVSCLQGLHLGASALTVALARPQKDK